jgi:hypothetical protein
MSTAEIAQLAQTLSEHAWRAPLVPAVWFVLRTHMARTAVWMLRVSAWDWR